jgi:hypothetical protein
LLLLLPPLPVAVRHGAVRVGVCFSCVFVVPAAAWSGAELLRLPLLLLPL